MMNDITEIATLVAQIIDRLRDKFPASQRFDDLISYVLPEQSRNNQDFLRRLARFLNANPKALYDESSKTYRFKPKNDIATSEQLLSYFQRQDTALGLQVKDLEEGWPDCRKAIDELEKEHKLLVTRNKKDNSARTVWANDPSLIAPLDQEFKDLFNTIPLPPVEDVIKELVRMNYTPTGELSKPEAALKVEKKKKKVRRGNRITNVHMQGLFRDYSDRRPQGR